MNNFFEQELEKLFGDGKVISNPTFSGRACLGTLGKDLRVRAQFITTRIADEYDALKLTVLNRTDGPVDTLTLKLKDLLGKKPVGNPNFPNGVIPVFRMTTGKRNGTYTIPLPPTTKRSGRPRSSILACSGTAGRSAPRTAPGWCTFALFSRAIWKKILRSRGKRLGRCSRRETFLSVRIS